MQGKGKEWSETAVRESQNDIISPVATHPPYSILSNSIKINICPSAQHLRMSGVSVIQTLVTVSATPYIRYIYIYIYTYIYIYMCVCIYI